MSGTVLIGLICIPEQPWVYTSYGYLKKMLIRVITTAAPSNHLTFCNLRSRLSSRHNVYDTPLVLYNLLILILYYVYSAFSLEEPLLCFVVNKYVLYSEKVNIVATGLKFAMSVRTSFCSVCRKSGLIMLVDSKVVAACVPCIGLQLRKMC